MRKALPVPALGGLILGGPQPDSAFVLTEPLLGATDIPVGQGGATLNYIDGSE